MVNVIVHVVRCTKVDVREMKKPTDRTGQWAFARTYLDRTKCGLPTEITPMPELEGTATTAARHSTTPRMERMIHSLNYLRILKFCQELNSNGIPRRCLFGAQVTCIRDPGRHSDAPSLSKLNSAQRWKTIQRRRANMESLAECEPLPTTRLLDFESLMLYFCGHATALHRRQSLLWPHPSRVLLLRWLAPA